MIKNKSFAERLNRLTEKGVPYVFIVDYTGKNTLVYPLDEAAENGILFDINGQTNDRQIRVIKPPEMQINPFPFADYRKAFEKVQRHIRNGNTYLLNLTFPSEIYLGESLTGIFRMAQAPYKIFLRDRFLSFSPETFINIRGNTIYSYPMKGTIDAGLPGAKEKILNDPKETYEHNTIVDLIRNDLSSVATDVELTRYRYVDKIQSNRGELLQVSSEIRGRLPEDWKKHFGEILCKLLPAGSVTGAPKAKTLEIIAGAENSERGFYTGIFGIFDGRDITSAVSIRFIEQKNGRLYYRSGGGITALSQCKQEYHELIRKIYIPVI